VPRPPQGSIPVPGLRWRGLNLRLFALFYLPLTGLVLLTTFASLGLHRDAMRTMVGMRDERAVRAAASALAERIQYRADAIHALGARAADGASTQNILDTSRFLLQDFNYGLVFYDPQFRPQASIGQTGIWQGETDHWLDFFATASPGSDPVFSPVIQEPIFSEPALLVSWQADPASPRVVGAFSVEILASSLLAGAMTTGHNFSAALVGPDLKVLYEIGDFAAHEKTETHPGISQALNGRVGTIYVQAGEQEHVIAFSPVKPLGWALVIEEPWESLADPTLNLTQLAPLALVPILLLSLVALWFGARQIIRPLQILETRAADLAWGNFDTIARPLGGIEEVQRLHRTLVHLADKIQRFQDGHHSYIGAITAGQEDERQRLARELHDDTIQALIALNQRVQLAHLKVGENTHLSASLQEIQSLTEQTIRGVRRLVRALRPLYLEDLGLVAALEMLARETSTTENITITFHTNGVEQRLPPETELALFRMAQEGLSNLTRHAQADRGILTLDFDTQEVCLTIEDDGVGFEVPESPAEFAPGGHFGLLGMHERAELVGARLEIESAPGQGTRLKVWVSLSN
jgi:two-component system sensor histidine kinase UhpB